ncbi:MAG TPA: DUF4595 domain-containing protein [Chitinophagaceae bacterium]|nr:DUF4595 domain-containing protein [Chitinophagaceae bacterium]
MKKIIAALAITAVFASCKKEKTEAAIAPPSTEKKIAQITYTEGSSTSIDKATYDANGRLLFLSNEDRIASFVYESDTKLIITIRKKLDNSVLQIIETTLNAKGAITKMLYKDVAGTVSYSYEYGYNADNYLNNVKGSVPTGSSFETKIEIVNGSAKSAQTFQNGALSAKTDYYYDAAKSNKMPNQVTAAWPSYTLFGKSNPHLLTEAKTFDVTGALGSHLKYTYELDANGYVSKATTTSAMGGSSSTISYLYQ